MQHTLLISIPTKFLIPKWAATNKKNTCASTNIQTSSCIKIHRFTIGFLITLHKSVLSHETRYQRKISESIIIIVLLSTLLYSCHAGLMTKLGKISVGSIYCCQEFNQVDSSRICVSIDIIPIFASVRRFFQIRLNHIVI